MVYYMSRNIRYVFTDFFILSNGKGSERFLRTKVFLVKKKRFPSSPRFNIALSYILLASKNAGMIIAYNVR